MKGNRLIALNLSLLLVLTLIAPCNIAKAEEHEYENWLIVDGVEYDATLNQSGNGWSNYYYASGPSLRLSLNDYHGGAIASNLALDIDYSGECVITGTLSYGIFSENNLSCGPVYYRGYNDTHGTLTVYGGNGYAAICSGGALQVREWITAIGGNQPALSGRYIRIVTYNTPVGYDQSLYRKVLVGSSATSAVAGTYTNQQYVSIELIPYKMTLHGNGGLTTDGKSTYQIVEYGSITPGRLWLYANDNVFTYSDKELLAWSDTEDSGPYHALDEEYEYKNGATEADLYAVWEDDVRCGVILNNYYGLFGSTGHHSGDRVVRMVNKGDIYSLPAQSRGGAVFDGWKAEDETIYQAGDVVTIQNTTEFEAQFTALKLQINGGEYDASKRWHYNPWAFYPSNSICQLNINPNYSGMPVTVPSNSMVYLEGIIVGTSEEGLSVAGDTRIQAYSRTENPLNISGGTNSPAIKSAGSVSLCVASEETKLIIEGGEGAPAIEAESVSWDEGTFLFAGPDADHLSLISEYNGEHYVEVLSEDKVFARNECSLKTNNDAGVRLVRNRETPLGNFCADAVHYSLNQRGYNVDIALMNGGGIRSDLPEEISIQDLQKINPWGNTLCVIEATGQEILDALEFGAQNTQIEAAKNGTAVGEYGSFFQVSGLKYKINTSIPCTCREDSKGIWIGRPTGDYRVHDVTVMNRETSQFETLDLDKTYRVGGMNFFLLQPGDGMAMFTGEVIAQDIAIDYAAMAEYLLSFPQDAETGLPVLQAGMGYDYPEGRIVVHSDTVEATIPEPGVEIAHDTQGSSWKVTLSDMWCDKKGLSTGVAAVYEDGKMIGITSDYYVDGEDLVLEADYAASGKNGIVLKIIAVDSSYVPVMPALAASVQTGTQ